MYVRKDSAAPAHAYYNMLLHVVALLYLLVFGVTLWG